MENIKDQATAPNTLGKVNEVVMQVLSALTPLEGELKHIALDAVRSELGKRQSIYYYDNRGNDPFPGPVRNY